MRAQMRVFCACWRAKCASIACSLAWILERAGRRKTQIEEDFLQIYVDTRAQKVCAQSARVCARVRCHLVASWCPFGAILGHLGVNWGLLGLILGPSWCPLVAILGHLGVIMGSIWAFLVSSSGLLGPSWGHLRPARCHLGASWGFLGPSLAHLCPSWGPLGAFRDHLEAILGPLGAILGPLGAILGPLGAMLGPLGVISGPPWGLAPKSFCCCCCWWCCFCCCCCFRCPRYHPAPKDVFEDLQCHPRSPT